jgi:hypothetical protein
MFVRTRSEYAEAHKELWSAMIKKLKKYRRPSHAAFRPDIYALKRECFNSLFSEQKEFTISYCFGCDWKHRHRECLFSTKESCGSEYNRLKCLDGLYYELDAGLERGTLSRKKMVSIAKKIRDFPVRKR